jgi:hypothetical protein
MKQRRAETGAERWVTRAEDGGPEARAGALLRQAVQREPLEASRLDAIRARLRRERRRPQRHWTLRLAIALGLVVSGGALTATAQRYLHWPALSEPTVLPPPVPSVDPAPARARTPARPAAPAPAPADELLPEPAPPPAPVPVPVPVRVEEAPRASAAPVASPSVAARRPAAFPPAPVTPPPVAPAAPSALAEESALIGEALRKLRQDDDAPTALAMLDVHAQRFPAGALAPEATLTRIEALLRMRRTGDALALLDRAAPVARGRGRDLLVARAELRATAGRQPAAVADFDLLLAGDPVSDSITERAFWGRAACRAAAGDAAGARRDLQDYLGQFPEGRFAGDARAALRP